MQSRCSNVRCRLTQVARAFSNALCPRLGSMVAKHGDQWWSSTVRLVREGQRARSGKQAGCRARGWISVKLVRLGNHATLVSKTTPCTGELAFIQVTRSTRIERIDGNSISSLHSARRIGVELILSNETIGA